MSTLSAKFAKLKNPAAGNNGGNRARVQQNVAAQQGKRAAQNQARRTGSAPQQNNNRPKTGTKGRGNAGRPIVSGVKKNLRKNGRNGKNGKKGGDKKAPTTSADLDVDMDQYWHAAGKGPDPVVASLDREMDEYHNKAKTAEPAAAPMSE